MKNLTGNEAFQAMASGQKIECRAIESDLDFDDIANHPATVFIDSAFEFRIAVILKQIGLMQVPASIKEAPSKGTQCFAPNTLTEKLVNGFKWKNSESDLALLQRGQVHLYEQHATIHAEALIKISGGTLIAEVETDNDLPFDVVEKVEPTQAITITEQTNVTVSEDNLVTPVEPKVNQFQIEMDAEIAAEEARKHQIELDDLLNSAANAKTPIEANALIRYTKTWTEEQRKPVLDAIHKRLVEIDASNPSDVVEPPSLMVQIQNAPDLTALDVLEIDISARNPNIQSKLMDCVKVRRFELENQATQAVAT